MGLPSFCILAQPCRRAARHDVARGRRADLPLLFRVLCVFTGVMTLSYRVHWTSMALSSCASGGGRFARRLLLVGTALLMGAAGTASAAGIPQIIHARQAHLHKMGRLAKSLRDQIWRSRPNWGVVVRDANQIEQLAAALPNWFPAGSGQGHGIKTRASAAIWAKPQAFAQAAHRLLSSSQDLAAAAARHDRRALALRSRALGRACGSCHRAFRARRSWW